MENAALYLRSSKDRSDVSIDAQRRELTAMAKARGALVIAEYSDTVESAKDENRPGFQSLLQDLKSPARAWKTLLITDTSRLSRRQYMAHVFDHECKKRGVSVLYAKLPETDPITEMVLKGVLRVFDELHSLMSRQKGLAGMAENVRKGYRAGGRAPRGYRLAHIETGAVRDGEPVRKSHLERTPELDEIGAYLTQRARGVPRSKCHTKLSKSTLNDLEWNALTYAGCTVWNMRQPKDEGRKRRPRSEWVIQEGTHEAAITMGEAEAVIQALESGVQARTKNTDYLLTGILKAPGGASWHGSRNRGKTYYRVPGRNVPADRLESAIAAQIKADATSTDFLEELAASCRNRYQSPQVDTRPIRDRIRAVEEKISALLDMALELADRSPVMRKIEGLEKDRAGLEAELDEVQRQNAATLAAAGISVAEIKQIIQWNVDASDLLPALVERIILDPDTLRCEIIYSVNVASPRGADIIAVVSRLMDVA